jgi:cysteine desulfurase / selenocysteine lyase
MLHLEYLLCWLQNTEVQMLKSNWRSDFPILNERVGTNTITYLDSAATAQKPKQVIDSVNNYYCSSNANVHRGLHELSDRATTAYEGSRSAVQNFINAEKSTEIVFVRGATEAINLVAQCYGMQELAAGDEIILSQAAHHANIVPWQNVARKTGAKIIVAPLLNSGHIDIDKFKALINNRTKIVAVEHVSNVLGCINDIKLLTTIAHKYGAKVLVDAAQSVSHLRVDVQNINCDFLVFSGHKLYASTGIGVLYARESLLADMDPYQFGGDMIEKVSFEKTTYNALPYKFEAGTPNIAGAVGLNAAINYLLSDWGNITKYEAKLHSLFFNKLSSLDGLSLVSKPDVGVYSFVHSAAHPHDIATILNDSGVAVRAGHHCAMPLVKHLGQPALLRVSTGLYSDEADLNNLLVGLKNVSSIMGV